MFGIPEWFKSTFLVIILGVMLLGLIKLAQVILGSELRHFMDALKSEIKEASKRAKTVGAINWYGFITIAAVGIIVIVASTGQKLIGLFSFVLGAKKAGELASYTNYTSLFFFLGIVLLISLICVVIDNRNKGR